MQISKKLVVATDNVLAMKGVSEIVSTLAGFALEATCDDPRMTFAVVKRSRPDILVLDVAFADALLGHARDSEQLPRIVLFCHRSHLGLEARALALSACAFVSHRTPAAETATLLASVANCGERNTPANPHCGTCTAKASLGLPRLPLSARELDVFSRIGRGHGPNAIAVALSVSVKTVETYRKNIKAKLALDSAHALNTAAMAWVKGEFPRPVSKNPPHPCQPGARHLGNPHLRSSRLAGKTKCGT